LPQEAPGCGQTKSDQKRAKKKRKKGKTPKFPAHFDQRGERGGTGLTKTVSTVPRKKNSWELSDRYEEGTKGKLKKTCKESRKTLRSRRVTSN